MVLRNAHHTHHILYLFMFCVYIKHIKKENISKGIIFGLAGFSIAFVASAALLSAPNTHGFSINGSGHVSPEIFVHVFKEDLRRLFGGIKRPGFFSSDCHKLLKNL